VRIVDCRKCRRFVWCEWPKIVFHKVSGIECDEYENGEEVSCDEEDYSLKDLGNPGK